MTRDMPTTALRARRHTRRLNRAVIHLVLCCGAVVMVAPYIQELLTSLKTLPETLTVPPTILPAHWRWRNYVDVFGQVMIGRQLLNSLIVAACRVAGQLLLCSAAAFCFARLSFPFRRMLFVVVLSVIMVPGQMFLIPTYQIMTWVGWLDTLQALFVPHIFSAFGVFLLTQFFRQLPQELDEAARLDGCNPAQIYWLILLPLVRPGLVALGILTLIAAWNDLLWPLVVNTSPEKLPIAAGLASLQGQYVTNYPLLMAASAIATLPVIIFFLALQRQFINGLASSGLK